MHYLIYKTTCLLNGKFYIGKHQTKNLDDGYFGSGILINRAVQRYGIENFTTEIIGEFNSEREMNLAEKILVVLDKEISYNLCYGGLDGGFTLINELGLTRKFTKEDIKRQSKTERKCQNQLAKNLN